MRQKLSAPKVLLRLPKKIRKRGAKGFRANCDRLLAKCGSK